MLIQQNSKPGKAPRKKVFYSYCHQDEDIKDRIDSVLTELKKDGLISVWHDRMLLPGDDLDQEINHHLLSSDYILLMVSPGFMASRYIQEVEVPAAMNRHNAGQARAIPIVVKASDWKGAPFSKLLILPRDARPVEQWQPPDEAYEYILEQLRLLLFGSGITDEKSGGVSGGQWILSIETDKEQVFNQEQLITTLREISGDYELELLGEQTQHRSVSSSNIGQRSLVLGGSAKAFYTLNKLWKDGALEKQLGLKVLGFESAIGSTVQSSSTAVDEQQQPMADAAMPGELMKPGRSCAPALLKAVIIKEDNPFKPDFIIDFGDQDLVNEYEISSQLADYFTTALLLKEDNLWVNLSQFESNRMLPAELEGSRLGEDLLEMDCKLKDFTASLLHPDTPTGSQYWRQVYTTIYDQIGTLEVPVSTYQKVWVVPEKATVFVNDGNPTDSDELDESIKDLYERISNGRGAIITSSKMKVMTETDLYALDYSHPNEGESKLIKRVNEIAMDIFRQMILPAIDREVNESDTFPELRQIYSAITLATWYKRQASVKDKMSSLVNSDDRTLLKVSIEKMEGLAVGTKQKGNEAIMASTSPFAGRENQKYFQQYIRQYNQGLYRCVRSFELGGQRHLRQYFSGAVFFNELTIKTKTNFL